MVKWYEKIGNYIFDYLILGLLLVVSTILLLPFYAIYVGIISFFKFDSNYKIMFQTIKENIKNIIYLTIILIIGLGLIYLTVVIGKTEYNSFFNTIVRYLIIGFMINIFIYPPVIMIEMKVTFKELLKNTLYLSLVQFSKTLFMFLLTALFIWLLTVEILVVLIFIPFIQTISYISNKAILELKKQGENQ